MSGSKQNKTDNKFAAYGDARLNMPIGKPHYHLDDRGFIIKCYHRAKVNPIVAFIVGTMVSFPLEHFAYDYIWPFTLIKELLKLK